MLRFGRWTTASVTGILPAGYADGIAQKVWTAAELKPLSPAEQDAIFAAGIVRDLANVPAEFIARVRTRLEEHIASTESPAQ